MEPVDFSRVPVFFHNYIRNVPERDLDAALQHHEANLSSLLREIPESSWDFRYAEGKWSIKELVQHVIDAERIFCYRALRFARKDRTELPGFDENSYAAASRAGKRTRKDLIAELETVQRSSVQLFASFNEEQLEQEGRANGNVIYVKALGYIIVGHPLHHKRILIERYLK